MKNAIPLLGRVLLGLLFAMSVMGKFGPGFQSTQQYMASVGMGATAFWLVIGIILELFGALSVILGVYPRLGAASLILFMVPVTFIFHTNFADQMETIQFMKNLSVTGGLILLAWYGGGEWTLDALWRKQPAAH
jgi:putative oxidoreductase